MTEQISSKVDISESLYQARTHTIATILGITPKKYDYNHNFLGFFNESYNSDDEFVAEELRRAHYETRILHNVRNNRSKKFSFPTLKGVFACQLSLAKIAQEHEQISLEEHGEIRQNIDLLAILYQTQGRSQSFITNARSFDVVLERLECARKRYRC